jgi:hypothetical protein
MLLDLWAVSKMMKSHGHFERSALVADSIGRTPVDVVA